MLWFYFPSFQTRTALLKHMFITPSTAHEFTKAPCSLPGTECRLSADHSCILDRPWSTLEFIKNGAIPSWQGQGSRDMEVGVKQERNWGCFWHEGWSQTTSPKQAVKAQRYKGWTHSAKKNFKWFKVSTLNSFWGRKLTVKFKLPLSLCYFADHQPNHSRKQRWRRVLGGRGAPPSIPLPPITGGSGAQWR